MNEAFTFLKLTEPFNNLDDNTLLELSKQLKLKYFEQKEVIYEQHKTPLTGLDIIKEGGYNTFFYNSYGKKELEDSLESSSCYGAFSILLNNGKSIRSVEVRKNTTVYQLSGQIFRNLCKANTAFYDYFLSSFGKEMLQERFSSYVSRQVVDSDNLIFDRYFVRRIESVNLLPIVTCPINTPTHDAARLMEENKTSCLFVENEGELAGYITDIIVRNKIVSEQRPSSIAVEEIMEGPIYRISQTSFIYEAVLMMFANKIRYLVVQANGKDIGMVSRNKLISDQAQSPFVFIQSVRLTRTTEELKQKWAQVPEIVYGLLSRGVKSELVNQVITSVTDTIALKVIENVINEVGEPPARFVFMSLGSEGRREQTLKTDQDNAIIYEDKANEFREKTRKYFLHFASLVSAQLNEIGFTYCQGDLMAQNPKWTHSLSHWKRNYDEWIDQPNAQAVMNFSTFFDCRLIYGDPQLLDDLKEYILQKLDNPNDLFFVQLANNALKYEPPLNFFRSIRTIEQDDRKVFDIKKAMTPIVDLVRAFALKHKILKTNTGERLLELKERKVFSPEDFEELMQSYYYLMGMRLKYQAMQIIQDHTAPHNFVGPDSLTKIEVVTVTEIFKVIENFQKRMKLVFARSLFGN
ncbi:DUF294 nucleotidyltransferase-like domain-containing protein [Marinoscillum sp. MHG1-6]|uniref:DUF294 nucleotidyltransferase-like domain-containing protein n=1 Tax=Marinoscillum sp. MHG1-6 TaxID=2959627 RepID=UPI002157C4F6|nr:DUF294 nucleotidyltransferase-like domain-containing protein [Marinoscillum sp. MHG1-6]